MVRDASTTRRTVASSVRSVGVRRSFDRCQTSRMPTTRAGLMKKLCLVVFAGLLVAACGSSASGPEGMDKSRWDAYCRHGRVLLHTFEGARNGTLTKTEFDSKLARTKSDIEGDSSAASVDSKDMATKIQAVADAIGRAKVAIDSGSSFDAGESDVATVATALPNCK